MHTNPILFHICTTFLFVTSASVTLFHQRGEKGTLQARGNNVRSPRNALLPNSEMKWDKIQLENGTFIIPYSIAGTYSDEEKSVIFNAMEKINRNTCVAFRKRTTENDYVDIVNKGGCSAYVGRRPGRNEIEMEGGKYGCVNKQSVMRNMLHIVGLFYEQRREDRDKFVKIHFENIKDGFRLLKGLFMKIGPSQASTYNLPYDYRSIMHFGKDVFAKDGKITIETLDPAFQDVIGTAQEPSVNDYKKVCFLYNCNQCLGKATAKNP